MSWSTRICPPVRGLGSLSSPAHRRAENRPPPSGRAFRAHSGRNGAESRARPAKKRPIRPAIRDQASRGDPRGWRVLRSSTPDHDDDRLPAPVRTGPFSPSSGRKGAESRDLLPERRPNSARDPGSSLPVPSGAALYRLSRTMMMRRSSDDMVGLPAPGRVRQHLLRMGAEPRRGAIGDHRRRRR